MKNEKAIKKLLEEITEDIYQSSEGQCPLCGEKDYPVCGDKKGYGEVLAEDAEEWRLDHTEKCPVTKLDQLLALLTEKPIRDIEKSPVPCPKCRRVDGLMWDARP
ncbi:hypothetical protein LCGC14_2527570, partial [marine sediment metagenome]